MNWSVETLNDAVDREISDFPETMIAHLMRIIEMIEDHGPQDVGRPHVRSLGDKLWEIRVKGDKQHGRAVYVTAKGKRVVIVHAFIKKSNTTPKKSLDLAKKRMGEIK